MPIKSRSGAKTAFTASLMTGIYVYIPVMFGWSVIMPNTASAAPLFIADWAQGVLAGSGKSGFKYKQVVSDDRLTVDQVIRRAGSSASLAVKVLPGDFPPKIGTSGERSEVLVMVDANGNRVDETASSGLRYFAFSVYVPTDWTPPQYDANHWKWGIIFQLHGPDSLSASPAFAFRLMDKFDVALTGGDLSQASNQTPRVYTFANSSLKLGKWVDFIIAINFSPTASGNVQVWRRDEGAADFTLTLNVANIPTLQYNGDVQAHYWKCGYYRSASATAVTRLNLGKLVRGSTFSEVKQAAFGG